MTYEQFSKVVLAQKHIDEKMQTLYEVGVVLSEGSCAVDSQIGTLFTTCISQDYGKSGLEWVEWFCWENKYGTGNLKATDSNKNPIAYSLESLYELLESDYRIRPEEPSEVLESIKSLVGSNPNDQDLGAAVRSLLA